MKDKKQEVSVENAEVVQAVEPVVEEVVAEVVKDEDKPKVRKRRAKVKIRKIEEIIVPLKFLNPNAFIRMSFKKDLREVDILRVKKLAHKTRFSQKYQVTLTEMGFETESKEG